MIDLILPSVKDIYYQVVDVDNKLLKHNCIRDSVRDLAPIFGYVGRREVSLKHLNGYCGFTDVIWYKDDKPNIAFEVESSVRQESVNKLVMWRRLGCEFAYILYYGARQYSLTDEQSTYLQVVYLKDSNTSAKRSACTGGRTR